MECFVKTTSGGGDWSVCHLIRGPGSCMKSPLQLGQASEGILHPLAVKLNALFANGFPVSCPAKYYGQEPLLSVGGINNTVTGNGPHKTRLVIGTVRHVIGLITNHYSRIGRGERGYGRSDG